MSKYTEEKGKELQDSSFEEIKLYLKDTLPTEDLQDGIMILRLIIINLIEEIELLKINKNKEDGK